MHSAETPETISSAVVQGGRTRAVDGHSGVSSQEHFREGNSYLPDLSLSSADFYSLQSLKEDVRAQSERERSLQLRYENLLVEQEDLQRKIDEHEKGLAAAKRAAGERAAEEAKRNEEEIRYAFGFS